MKKFVPALIVILLILLSGCSKEASANTDSLSASTVPKVKEEAAVTSTPTPAAASAPAPTAAAAPTAELLREDTIGIVVPQWIILELTEPVVEEFIYFQSEYRFITEDDTANTYYLDKNDYNKLVEILNPPDFALVKKVYPEDYALVDSIQIDENGDTINVAVLNNSFFTSQDRTSISNLAYQCALYKCIMGIEQNDIYIEINYTVLDSKKDITSNVPFRINSVVDTTNDMQHEFTIHIPLQYTMGDPELTKQQLIKAGVSNITINKDGTLDYVATKELILKMGSDYTNMMNGIFQDIINGVNYITKIYYDDLNTTIVIEIDFESCDIEHLVGIQNYLNSISQFQQLFSGVKEEDIQFKIVSVDNAYREKILESSYPPYGE